MMDVSWDQNAVENLYELPWNIGKNIVKKVNSARRDPFNLFKRLKGTKKYRLRSGDYRVIASIDQENNQIVILKVAHRKNVYK